VEGGGPYLRRDVVMGAESARTFTAALKRASLALDASGPGHLGRAGTSGLRAETTPLVTGTETVIPNQKKNVVYDPSHPDADAEGYVTYPDINIVTEMVDLMVASRAFDADVTVVHAAKSMITKSLEI